MTKIGKITTKNIFDYKMSLNKVTKRYEVIGKDGFRWAESPTTKGVIISACNCGIPLRKIDITEDYVPIQEVIEAIKQ